jgi:hypothetical protein
MIIKSFTPQIKAYKSSKKMPRLLFQDNRNQRELSQFDKRHPQKLCSKHHINGFLKKEANALPLRWGQDEEVRSHHLYFTLYWKF